MQADTFGTFCPICMGHMLIHRSVKRSASLFYVGLKRIYLITVFEHPRPLLSCLNKPSDMAVGDLDGDGFGDVVVACQGADKVTWFRNLNGEAFSIGVDIDTNVDGATDVTLADIDGDGHLDVLAAIFREGALLA